MNRFASAPIPSKGSAARAPGGAGLALGSVRALPVDRLEAGRRFTSVQPCLLTPRGTP